MKLKILVIILAAASVGSLNAQQISAGRALPGQPNLQVGDQLPDFFIGKLINAKKGKVNTSDFKDQLLIIDFWATTCGGCVAALPKMDTLQKQFGKKIKVLPITYEPESLVMPFWKNNPKTKMLSLSSVVEDKVFESYFRHKTIPHEVWVYKGKVIGITSHEYVNANSIDKVLSGTVISWPVKNDFYVFDATKQPLFAPDPNQTDTAAAITYAAISDYKEGVNAEGLTGGAGIVRDPKKKTVRTFFLNQPVYNSYLINFINTIDMDALIRPCYITDPNQVVWEVKDKSKYIYEPKSGYVQEWIRKYGICFESVYPDSGQSDKQIYQSVNDDLDRLLGLKVRWEKRKEKVLVLVRSSTADLLKSKQKLSGYYDVRYAEKGNLHQFRDSDLSALVSLMNQQSSNPYVFDETGYTGRMDMDLTFSSWTDISAIRKAIAKYGLDLKEEERLVDKLVFTEINGAHAAMLE